MEEQFNKEICIYKDGNPQSLKSHFQSPKAQTPIHYHKALRKSQKN